MYQSNCNLSLIEIPSKLLVILLLNVPLCMQHPMWVLFMGQIYRLIWTTYISLSSAKRKR